MNYKAKLTLSLAIVYRASVLSKEIDVEFIEDTVSNITTQEVATGPNYINVESFKELIFEILNDDSGTPYSVNQLINRIQMAVGDDEHWYTTATEAMLDVDIDDTKAKLLKDTNTLYNVVRDSKLTDILRDASYQISSGKIPANKSAMLTDQVRIALDELSMAYGSNNAAIVTSSDTDDLDGMVAIYDKANEIEKGSLLYKYPIDYLNIATNGGLRLNETVMVSALPHDYKSGFTLQLTTGIVQINSPVVRDKGRPTLLRISFEDSIENNYIIMYNDMYYNEFGVKPPTTATTKEKAEYVNAKLISKGWCVKMIRVNPSDWSYKDIINYVESIEKDEDKDVQILILDYLMLIPTVGCITSGPQGTDLRDLLRRMRNWGSARETAIITPHQLNTTAKARLNEVQHADFLNSIKGKGMFAGSGQLDQEFDVGILIHLVEHGGHTYLNVVVDKHRSAVRVENNKKSFWVKFEHKTMPLRSDLLSGTSNCTYTLPVDQSELL